MNPRLLLPMLIHDRSAQIAPLRGAPGMEFTMHPWRAHFTTEDNLPQFTLPTNRPHFDLPSLDG